MVAAQVQAAPAVPWVRVPGGTRVSADLEPATLQARSGAVCSSASIIIHHDAPYKLVVFLDR